MTAAGDVLEASRTIATTNQAVAVVWLQRSHNGEVTLLVVDANGARILSRKLNASAPLSPENATDAARMVRTMLRALAVIPDIKQVREGATGIDEFNRIGNGCIRI